MVETAMSIAKSHWVSCLDCAFQQRPLKDSLQKWSRKLKITDNYKGLDQTILDNDYTRKDLSNEYKYFFNARNTLVVFLVRRE